ncbi:hypothetical protein PRZ48_004085 [Zasmidium cellare]|uniref:F-box domain-containing protein n=1 Tax=Zasmidium cellare TaxID=395010 RepID=A0ABR0EXF7_ZASCE|nr:hypothetical protein PRZ48_004085 [Zasmidium cellare]
MAAGDGILESQPDFNIEYRHSSVSQVRFTDSTCHNVVVDNCDWQNVTFTDCQLDNVVFRNVVLEGAHFSHMDFGKVTFQDGELRDVRWVGERLKNAVLSPDLFETALSGVVLEVPIIPALLRSKTRGGRIGSYPSVVAERTFLHNQPGMRSIKLTTAPTKGLMSLPDSIITRIARYLLPDAPVNIIDLPAGSSSRACTYQSAQTHYSLPGRSQLTTYTSDQPHPDQALSFLGVNRRLNKIGTPVLYGRRFQFKTSHQSCLAFLHDHQKDEHAIKRLTLVHSGIEKGDEKTFKELVDVLLHTQPDLHAVTVYVGKAFWDSRSEITASIESRYERSRRFFSKRFDWRDCRDPAMVPSFLKDLARLPLNHAGHQLSIMLHINGFEAPFGRIAFKKALLTEFSALRQIQPASLPKTGYPRCQEKILDKCQCKRPGKTNNPRKVPNLLELPDKALKRILHCLFPVDQLRILEKPNYVFLSPDSAQTTYYRKRTYFGSQTTYVAWDHNLEEKQILVQRVRLPRLGIGVSFLRVNRRCYELGIPHLYSKGLQFDSNPATCLAFLHDHQRHEHSIRHIALRIDSMSGCQSWRRLFNLLVHRRSDLRSLTVKIGAEFWDTMPWQTRRFPRFKVNGGVDEVLKWKDWCRVNGFNGCCGDRNFLGNVARLPLKKRRGQELRVELLIDGEGKCPDRKEFGQRLRVKIDEMRKERPDLTWQVFGVCREKRRLDDTCYWDAEKKCEAKPST